ncbi:MAG: hypothetical protein H6719_12120 [Sandaracinaceae bacterium]|nr:hypothetical protein [Sandaracinaceae bacterium]
MRSGLSFTLLFLASAAIAGCDPGSPPPNRDGGGGDAGTAPSADTDGDTISDADEGRATNRDTDGDGTPDYLDDDSDGDGIFDIDEAGDDNPATPPRDADSDGMPDFIDTDSDGNGILDGDEVPGDVDGDGTPNFADTDDDNDLINDRDEIAGMPSSPPDFDMDGTPDYQDRDSDNDSIMDGHERDADTDMDGVLDVNDLDSDDDGLTDAMEAGDADLDTLPVDTDMDGTPDFRDTDSDNDGLSDHDEVTVYMTSPTAADSDGDGVSDLIEVAGGTDPGDPTDSPRTRGDFVFLVPYMMPPDPTEDTLMFRTNIAFADIYFLFDHSGSMGPETDALRGAVVTIMNDLQCTGSGTACTRDADCAAGGEICSPFTSTCIEDPGTSSCILSPYTGIGHYETSYTNSVSIQADPAVTAAASWSITGGTEELYEAVIGVVDPGMVPGESGCTGPNPGFIGCVDYRTSAVRILIAFTDEDSDGSTTVAQAAAALTAADVTFVGVWSATSATGRNALVDLANASGSVDRTGAPLVFDGDGPGVVPAVTAAINEIVEGVPLRVTIAASDEPGDDGDSLQFIDRLQTNTTDPGCSAVATEDTDGDGFDDAFPSVTPGTPVCWDVIPRQNDTVMPTAVPQIFEARLTVSGDGSPLDSRRVFFLIPPEIPGPGGPD